ncbi:MAG: chondroitinase [Prevotella sp.]|jgi:hypothetical protein|nr:chondroitinase [Prevotella sp.]
MNRFTAILLILSCFAFNAQGQNYTFEESAVPADWTAQQGSLSLSSEHYKQGAQSLCWETAGTSRLIVSLSAAITATSGNSAFMQLYLPEATNDTLVVEFMNGITPQRTANFLCTTRGWREFNRAYKDYASSASVTINALRITLKPVGGGSRKIYFDDVHLAQTTQSGHVPGTQWLLDRTYITTNNTPLTLYANPTDLPLSEPSAAELSDLAKLRTSAYQSVTPAYNAMQAIVARNYVNNKMNLSRNADGSIRGRVINTTAAAFTLDTITDILQRLSYLAGAVENNGAADMQAAFSDYLDHVLDQGFSEGCNIAFASNSYTEPRAVFPLLLSLLPSCNDTQRAEVIKLARWMSFYGMMYEPETSYLSKNNSDVIYLFAPYMQTIAACHVGDAVAIRELKAFKRFLERNTEYVPGGNDMLKIDGTGFHHNTHYNNYMYAYQPLLECIYTLKGTEFRISAEAYERFKKAIVSVYTMATLNTNDTRHFANTLSGRNPFDAGMTLYFSKTAFEKLIAVGGDCYGASIDEELAGAYNYFFESTKYNVPEKSFDGFFQFNYSPMGIFRKGNWVASMRAPTTKFWGAEIYKSENRFGRYQSHGCLEITYKNSLASSGYPTNKTGGGWDWNVIPGTTTVHYTSWQEMMPNKNTSDRFDQYTKTKNFSGALAFGNCGIFATDFDQIDNWGSQRFTPTNLVFKKSMFCFDNMIVSLGSDISSSGTYASDMITATNLFQNIVSSSSGDLIVNGNVKVKPYSETMGTSAGNWLITPQGTGYYVFGNNDALVIKYDAQTTPKETGADYAAPTTSLNAAKAYLNHGVKPSSKSYSFAVFPETTPGAMQSLTAQIGNEGGNLFRVEAQTASLHAVSYQPQLITGYSFFAAATNLPFGVVKSTTSQHLLMVKSDTVANRYYLAACNPNLNPQTDAVFGWKATPTQTTLTLKGEWKAITETEGVSFAEPANNETQVSIVMKEGEPVYFGIKSPDDNAIGQAAASKQITFSVSGGTLTLVFPAPAALDATVSLYAANGVLCHQQQVQASQNRIEIPVARLPKGVFFCFVSDAQKRKSFKWINN